MIDLQTIRRTIFSCLTENPIETSYGTIDVLDDNGVPSSMPDAQLQTMTEIIEVGVTNTVGINMVGNATEYDTRTTITIYTAGIDADIAHQRLCEAVVAVNQSLEASALTDRLSGLGVIGYNVSSSAGSQTVGENLQSIHTHMLEIKIIARSL